MTFSVAFVMSSVLLGVGLAMDAFSVSVANGLADPRMKPGRMWTIASVFALFQLAMPLIGWFCVHTILQYFKVMEKAIPWIALALLAFIGGKMILEAVRGGEDEEKGAAGLGFGALMVQGIATSIDALSVGFAIADYNFVMAFASVVLIGLVTLFICYAGLIIGKTVGNKFSKSATIFGGVILILIGLEIFITGVF